MEYIEYRLSDPDTAKSKQVIPYAHAPLLGFMEYAGLAGTMWAGMIVFLHGIFIPVHFLKK
jgi:hypothetical protein